MIWDWGFVHGLSSTGIARWNVCFADGHAKSSRYVDDYTRPQNIETTRMPFGWNDLHPDQPVNIEKLCEPTCAQEAARDD